jgi:hypothetical protein
MRKRTLDEERTGSVRKNKKKWRMRFRAFRKREERRRGRVVE